MASRDQSAQSDPRKPEELVAAICAEMCERFSQGGQPRAEEFLALHPHLTERPESAIDILYEEYCQREALGEQNIQQDLLDRFPGWSGPIRVVVECHNRMMPPLGVSPSAANSRAGNRSVHRRSGRENTTVPGRSSSMAGKQQRWVLVAIWVVAFGAALAIDGPVARQLAPWRDTVKQSVLAEEIKEGGHAGILLVAALLVVVLHPGRWRATTLLGTTAIVVGVLRLAIAIVVGRVRPVVRIAPFEFFEHNGGFSELLRAKNLSFPSGHASFAFATATALTYLMPKGRWLFFVGASLVGIERVAESAHYVSDVIAAALLGILTFKLALRINDASWKWFDRQGRREPTRVPPRSVLDGDLG